MKYEKKDKFKECYLPYSYYNEEKNQVEIIRANYLSNEIDIYDESDYNYVFEDYTRYSLVYNYEIKYKTSSDKEARVHLSHSHSFLDVIKKLYQFPESFKIPPKHLDDYSNQELIYIKRLKNFFKLINLSNIDYNISEDERLARCKNLKVLEYQNFGYIELEDLKIEKFLKDGVIDLKFNDKLSDCFFDRKQLIVNKNQDFVAIGKAFRNDKDGKNNNVSLVLSEKI